MANSAIVITPEQLLEHWQGHRRVTRRLIAAFPADQFETFTIGGLRPFSGLVQEMLAIGVPSLKGFVHRDWTTSFEPRALSKDAALKEWDAQTDEINALFPKIRAEQWQEHDKAFGMYEGPTFELLWYALDNEIHHRGQAYVYFRALGIEPPPFYDRS
ncbi:MAG: damage-inducible protein DinB [Gemmatimonadaceae bacterium]|nr:damage-inducible protein DinB [Gemmatimonadaceae bacterium]